MQSCPGPGVGGRQELEARHPHVFLGLGRPPGVCNREFWFFLLNITSLLTILELPRLSESRQPKGISPLTCDVKNTVISGKLRHEGRAWACVLYIDLLPVSYSRAQGKPGLQTWTLGPHGQAQRPAGLSPRHTPTECSQL